MWAKLDGINTYDPLIGVTQDSNNYAFVLCLEPRLRLYTKSGGGLDWTNTHSTAIGTGVWYHIAAVMDASSNCTLYVNGAGEPSGWVTRRNNLGRLHIARMANAGAWNQAIDGLMDDVRIYDRALSGTEVAELYDMGQVLIESVTADDPVAPNDPDDNDVLSDGDTLTVVFDEDTNQPPVGTKAGIDGLINFENSLGTAYTGVWAAADTLVITVVDATGGTLAVGDTVTIIADGTDDLTNAAGTNPASTASGQIAGDWGLTLTTGLVAYWKLDNDGAVNVAVDSSGGSNDGALTNFPGDGTEWVPGQIDGALRVRRVERLRVGADGHRRFLGSVHGQPVGEARQHQHVGSPGRRYAGQQQLCLCSLLRERAEALHQVGRWVGLDKYSSDAHRNRRLVSHRRGDGREQQLHVVRERRG